MMGRPVHAWTWMESWRWCPAIQPKSDGGGCHLSALSPLMKDSNGSPSLRPLPCFTSSHHELSTPRSSPQVPHRHRPGAHRTRTPRCHIALATKEIPLAFFGERSTGTVKQVEVIQTSTSSKWEQKGFGPKQAVSRGGQSTFMHIAFTTKEGQPVEIKTLATFIPRPSQRPTSDDLSAVPSREG